MKQPGILAGTAVRLATSTKEDGHMSFSKISDEKTEANINRFVDSLGWADKSRAFIRITYGEGDTHDVITTVSENNKPPREFVKKYAFKADALIANLPKVVLLLPTADCYPVTIYDPNNKVLALAHIGWHSSAVHLPEKVILRMQDEFNSKSSDVLVHIGPGIPADYYTFEEPAQLNMPGWQRYLKKQSGGWGIDLLGYNLQQLKLSGVTVENIEVDPRNTIETEKLESNYMHNKAGLPVARRFLTAAMF